LWSPAREGEDTRLYLDIPAKELPAIVEQFRKHNQEPASLQAVTLPDRSVRYSGILSPKSAGSDHTWGQGQSSFERGNADKMVVDLSLTEQDGFSRLRPEVGGWLACGPSPLPWLGLWGRFHSPPGEPPGPYALVWQAQPASEDRKEEVRLAGLDPRAHQERCRELAEQGYQPWSVAATLLPGVGPRVASVWVRPRVYPLESVRWASQQANRAATLARLGDRAPAWRMLRHRLAPDVRSHLIERFQSPGVEAEQVVARLSQETDVSARRALILALGDYRSDELPKEVRDPLVPRLLDWYRQDQDAGIHGAIDWLLRHDREGDQPRPLDWGLAARQALQQIDAELAGASRALICPPRPAETATHPPAAGWWVNSERQTFAVLSGPVEFVMGTPIRGLNDLRQPAHRRRIERSFAVATKAVTVGEFRRFVEAQPGLGWPSDILDQFKTKDPSDLEKPIVHVTLYEAAQYCRWLSDQERLPEDQMCFPSIEEIQESVPGVKPLTIPADYLTRTGYRLPTEAEWEYACRAGVDTTRYYGWDEYLLGRYAWWERNAKGRPWPVGQKRPNDLGLADMLGNVLQWTSDPAIGSPDLKQRPFILDELPGDHSIQTSTSFAVRGGSYSRSAELVECAGRLQSQPQWRLPDLGFRVVRTCP
jgi:formylglycine-generating enzyme required for sulfatase activity